MDEDLSKELELQIKGAEQPSMWDLLAVRFVLLPYTIGKVKFHLVLQESLKFYVVLVTNLGFEGFPGIVHDFSSCLTYFAHLISDDFTSNISSLQGLPNSFPFDSAAVMAWLLVLEI